MKIREYEKLDKRICMDADDDNILALARDGDVDYIITGDKDLLVLEEFESVPILDLRGFWGILRKDKNLNTT
jgi:predicted nucleic acid-binding protein